MDKYISIKWQEGPIKENGVNGAQIEDVILAAMVRLQQFQVGPLSCPENDDAIKALGEARAALHRRSLNRKAQGVEGTYVRHES